MAETGTFQRVEKKYLLNEEIYQALLERLKNTVQLDEYGMHTICNIYYDTEQYDLIRNSIEKPVYKEKFRLRSYGVPNPDSTVYLEIKKKWKGIVYKRRTAMSLKEAEEYLEHGIKPQANSQILGEIDYFLQFYKPKPKLYLAYDREAYFGKEDPNLRITFDKNIRSREEDLLLEMGDAGKLLLGRELRLMEIKVGGAFPMWLSKALSELGIYQVSFSKYGSIYKQNARRLAQSFVQPAAHAGEIEGHSGLDWQTAAV